MAACGETVVPSPSQTDGAADGEGLRGTDAAANSDAQGRADANRLAGVDAQARKRTLVADAWADNWFAAYVGDQQVGVDSVPITTEKSFNREQFSFDAAPPFTLSVVLKDFKQDDSGLEYIGKPNQQMGDGGFILQLRDQASGELLAVTDAAWRCKPIHRAPLDKSCVKDPEPLLTCGFASEPEPEGWRSEAFDDSSWPQAVVHPAQAVGPKDGYLQVAWDPSARFIWSADLQADNIVLCRLRIGLRAP